MASTLSVKPLSQDRIWLKVERINDALRVTDQDGCEVGGVCSFLVQCGLDELTQLTITVNCASRQEDGTIQYNIRG